VGTKIVVESAPGVTTSGRLVDAAAGVVRFQGDDPNPIAIPVRPGARLREPRRGWGALLGTLAGMVTGGVLGIILTEQLGTPNPDSAGGVEHPPVVLPVSLLAGIVLGSVTGYFLGLERRLEFDATSP